MGLVGKERIGSNDKQVILQAGLPDFFQQADDYVGSATHTQCSIEPFVCRKRLAQALEAMFRRSLATLELCANFFILWCTRPHGFALVLAVFPIQIGATLGLLPVHAATIVCNALFCREPGCSDLLSVDKLPSLLIGNIVVETIRHGCGK